MRKITTYIIALFSVLAIFSSCKKEYETIEELDKRTIDNYVQKSGLTFLEGTNGYRYRITTQGTGSTVSNSDSIYYQYAFKKLDGTLITETHDLMRPGTLLGYTDQFAISNITYSFKPVREVLGKLNRGGKATLILPSKMAFGKNGLTAFNVGSNEPLLVEMGIYEQDKRHKVDEYEINKFIANNNLTMTTDPSKIRYNVITPGTGTDAISEYSSLVVNYTGRYLDGSVVDSGTGATLRLDQLIKGWQIILPGRITAGGKIRIIIPYHLAYGVRPLDFDIEVTTVTN